jgi:peptidyl-prolyl cis-trans isomerase SurA
MKIYLFIFLCLFISESKSIETKIIHKIQKEIITNIDIKNELKFLLVLNNNLKELDKEKLLNISNQSIVNETIKKIEILKNFKEVKISDDYLTFLLSNMYSKLNLKSLDEFKVHLINYDLTLEQIKKKIIIEALWNELIIKKYNSLITIDEDQIKKEISKKKFQSKNYKLSEILFEIKNKEDVEKKYNTIIESIADLGFENSASIYSFSKSSKIGGDIGWISESSLNSKINKNINYLETGDISRPIILPNGVLILKVVDIKISQSNINLDDEYKKAIDYERNRQLNQYSKIYFNKTKKNLDFDG